MLIEIKNPKKVAFYAKCAGLDTQAFVNGIVADYCMNHAVHERGPVSVSAGVGNATYTDRRMSLSIGDMFSHNSVRVLLANLTPRPRDFVVYLLGGASALAYANIQVAF